MNPHNKLKLQAWADNLAKLKKEFMTESSKLETAIADIYNRTYSNSASLQQDIHNLNKSNEYGCDDMGIYSWVRLEKFELPTDPAALKALENYLNDCGYGVDVENKALFEYQCQNIQINEDGDVFDTDSGKFVIQSNEYATRRERNALILAYMKTQGVCYPVFRVDYYGTVNRIDITKK